VEWLQNVARFKEYVLPLMGRVFESPLKHTLKAAEARPPPLPARHLAPPRRSKSADTVLPLPLPNQQVIGNKAIVEESVEAKMKNGQDYHNK